MSVLNIFRERLEGAKQATNGAPKPPPPRPMQPKGGLAGVARAALNARGAGKQRQAIRLARRMGRS